VSAAPDTSKTPTSVAISWIARRDGLDLAVRSGGPKGLGAVIVKPGDSRLIDGVRVAPCDLWPDDRGYFLEVARLAAPDSPGGDELAHGFANTQVSATLSYPGTIKALHYHCKQTDLWTPVRGMFQVVLYDLRVESSTFGCTNTLYIGVLRPWKLRIPPGVAHGYKVLGTEPALLVYLTNCFYDPADEGRIPYDHPDINYDWELQHK
jgi:dTDP-4-dehydrorhamnose 3,5-epimerase